MVDEMSEIKKKESNWWSYILFQFLWLIVIMPKEIQFAMLAGISCILIWKGKKQRPDLVVCCVLAYAGCHILSILYNAITGEYSIIRILAACNTALIWIVAAGIYHFYRWNEIDDKKLAKTGFINGVCMSVFSLFFLIGRNFTDMISVPVINCILFDREKDMYINRIRFWGFLEYPTLVVAFELLVFPFVIWYIWTNLPPKVRVAGVAVGSLATILPVYYCYSRSGYVLLALEILIFGVLLLSDCLDEKKKKWMMIGLMVIAFLVIFVGNQLIIKVFDKLMNMRAGSNGTRSLIYAETWTSYLRHPLIGCAIKALSSTGYPLGSHCSYLGFLYKTGIIGTVFIMVALGKNGINMIHNILRGRHLLIILGSVSISLLYLYFLFEDMDGANWLLCMWMAVSGKLSSKIDFCSV